MPTVPANASAAQGARSCQTCPSNLASAAQGTVTGRSIGGPICGLKLIPLSRPGGPQNKTFEHFAKGCDKYGKETVPDDSAKRRPLKINVGFPMPVRPPEKEGGDPQVSNCRACVNFIPTMSVKRATGWAAGYCRAKGDLILDDRLDKYALGCTQRAYAQPGERINDGSPVEIMLLPEYALDFGKPKKPNPFKVHELNLTRDPRNCDTDVPLSDNHKARGIRAIRKIADPRGVRKDLFLPILDENAIIKRNGQMVPLFDDYDKRLIPRSGDSERPEKYFDHNGAVYKLTVSWVYLKQTPALWGMPGVGKTEIYRHMAWMMGMPFYRVSITESSEVDDMIGKMMYTPDKGTYFQYGRIPRAWRRPNVLCLDEPNAGPDAIWQFIRPLTDDSKQMVIDQNEGERIASHPLCYLGLAMNPAWDPRNRGVAPLADADQSRLSHVEMGLPPEHIERKILEEVLVDDKWEMDSIKPAIDIMMKIAKDLRALSNEGTIPFTWGIRPQKKVIRLTSYMSWVDAFGMGVMDSLEPDVRDIISKVVRDIVPDDAD